MFDIVVALDRNGGIGKGGALPWRLSGDMKHFVSITKTAPPGMQNAVIMGRKTWDSIPDKFRPLAQRKNIVLSQSVTAFPGGHAASSLEEALALCRGCPRTFVIGGGAVYREALDHPQCHDVYLTCVEGTFDCDVFFPNLPDGTMMLSQSDTHVEGGVCFRFEHHRLPGHL